MKRAKKEPGKKLTQLNSTQPSTEWSVETRNATMTSKNIGFGSAKKRKVNSINRWIFIRCGDFRVKWKQIIIWCWCWAPPKKSNSIDDGGTKSEFPFELNKLLWAGGGSAKVHSIKSTAQFEVILRIFKRDEMFAMVKKAKRTFHLLPI